MRADIELNFNGKRLIGLPKMKIFSPVPHDIKKEVKN
jgi:hypothetical protein